MDEVEITLIRGPCFGKCPVYSVTITGSGEVRYFGTSYVDATGEQSATISPDSVAGLVQRFDEIDFDTLLDEYRGPIADLPVYTIALRRDGSTKTVIDHGGTRAGMPKSVRELEDAIDRVGDTARWVLRNGEKVREPNRAGPDAPARKSAGTR